MEMTPGQIAASTIHDRALVVEAGAGTGKTHTLVGRFLHLLEEHPDWPLDSLTAVTFTDKAAREMRTRIRQAIEMRAQDAPSESIWQERRRSLERLQVSTIHGLCTRMLRENAIAAGLDPNFDVIDEQQTPALKEDAVRQALAELVEIDDPALALLAGLEVRDLQRQLTDLLNQRGTVQRLFDQLPPASELIERWRQAVAEMRQTAWQDLLARTPDLEDAMQRLREVAILDEADALAAAVRAAKTGCDLLDQCDLVKAVQTWLSI